MAMISNMKTRYDYILGILGALAIVCIVGSPKPFHIFNFYFTTDPIYLAKNLVTEGRSITGCIHMISWDFLPPSTAERKDTCVHEYATLSKNPSQCERLRGYNYSILSCAALATGKEPCGFYSYTSEEIRGNGLETTYAQCLNGPDSIKNNACCIIARIRRQSDNIETCDNMKGTELINPCHHEMARQKKNISECALINSENIRAACEVEVRALKAK